MTELDRIAQSEISIAAKGLMLVLRSFRQRGKCRPKRDQLIQRSGLSSNTLYEKLAELRTAGFLNTEEIREKGRIRTMFILFPAFPNHTAPCRKKWGKTLVGESTTRVGDFTHACARVINTASETHTLPGSEANAA
jgi:DNA-binding HxlR family transcriptional regulator